MTAPAPAPHIPENPWSAAPAATIVGELERLAAVTACITNRDACVLFEAADRLRVPSPAPATFEPVDPDGTLFEAPRLRPPGSFYAVRRVDGEGMGEDEEAVPFVIVNSADDWRPAERDAGYFKGQTEYEMVLMVPKSIGKRTFGRGRAGDSTPRCSTEVAT
jgi:hypothetical protein